ncbi:MULTISPECIES: aldehyde dehydrogenase family protein [unclassified Mesorhizobium]|uniref:aldehyde dehydrogenase family protein n=1 Tax=unclassified Mesorhizobium TaxID=325217 RepID=UPI0010933E8E|nr:MULTISPECIES: aldehyde dehydrogenase family protein [unclassified Mesorhizobium]TGQ77290.1 aldehyde dehydrogenase family protein [Mesorhizobium sp. M8A.F.Ca.ET.207.01.1.1]TGS39044.1 aldehyde dehydrogenase family protein [Mesorhizobium sp. M8A.F.Ca.ET.182.01.1.1]TGS77325.1 aldehyde dehydrogenase family protein [Mesorhizobium sp. M8A.F.Ca.ET.181.01.1.1]TGT36293.1 aldehyde dehydrogenase family protein [Mesorhizobium sp. M8A.F.Ca.ET.165.01.1.1]
MHHHKFYISGEWVDPVAPQTMDVINPSTEEPFAQISLGAAADVDKAVLAARRAFPAYSATSVAERVELLDQIANIYEQRLDEFAKIITLEMGAPAWFSRQVQVTMALSHFREARRVLQAYDFEAPLGTSRIVRESIGVCGLITAWNWPLGLVASKLAYALAAGCCVVLKPSEIAPLSSVLLAEVLHDAGVPAGVFNLVNGTGPVVGHAICSHPDVDMVSFTGSTGAGIQIAKTAADTVKRVHQELGGKSANIILPDADLDEAIPAGVLRAFTNSGQACVAPTRMLVQRDQMPRVVEIARRALDKVVVGHPDDAGTRLGPLISQAQFDRVQTYIQLGIDEGAQLVGGGLGRPNGLNRGYYVRPTIFADVAPGMRIAQEEIFGPVLSIIGYEDEDEAVEIANGTVFGLAAYVHSANLLRAQAVARKLRAGRAYINMATSDTVAPFGGYRQSGNGRENGVFGLEEYLEVKAILGWAAA